jgi:hypothetical protein
MITARPLSDWSDEELRKQLALMTPSTALAYSDIVNELDRRAVDRRARMSLILGLVATVAAAVAAIASAIAAIAALQPHP